MSYYPVFFDIENKPCLVVGGGAVAERKAVNLLSYGAKVTIISPKLTKGLKKLVDAGKIRHIPRGHKTGDIKGFFLAISATDSEKVNREVYNEAEKLNIPLNVVDNPKLCNFIVPSVVKRGSLQIAISTSGKSPYFAKTLRKLLDESLPLELAVFVELIGAIRNKLLKQGSKNDKKLRIYAELLESPLLDWLRKKQRAEINRFLKQTFGKGKGFNLSSLGIKL